jgi:hypothetical protein
LEYFDVKDALGFEYAENVEVVKVRFISHEKLLKCPKNQL